jgi:hypothetical protein
MLSKRERRIGVAYPIQSFDDDRRRDELAVAQDNRKQQRTRDALMDETCRRWGIPLTDQDPPEGDTFARALVKAFQRPARDTKQTEAAPAESPEELRKQIRKELLAELHRKLAVPPSVSKPAPPERAAIVRDPDLGLRKFFEMIGRKKT